MVDGTNAANNTRIDYSGNIIYEDNQLKAIFTSEGRIVKDGSTYKFEYNMKDHLGNVRVAFIGQSSGTPLVTQRSSYFPFGMVAEQTNSYSSGILGNKFLYNGKELQDDDIAGVKLDWYDYGARFYDPALARWHVQDPLTEKYYDYSPYNYCLNNPILFIDPDGMEVKNGHKEEREEAKAASEKANKAHEENMADKGIKSTDGMSRKERKEAGVQDTYKAAQKADKEFKRIDADYQKVESVIAEVKSIDSEMFEQMDNLTYTASNGSKTEIDIYVTTGSLSEGSQGGTTGWGLIGTDISGHRGNVTLSNSASGVHLAHEFGHMYSLSLDPVGYTKLVRAAGSGYDCQTNRGNPISIHSLGFQDRFNQKKRGK
ncbi:MAG: hypothetical protein JXP36_13925 [Bacteroidales bacterium]|nr:hypothetical protein [Bacteroidales bacterium]